MIKLKRKQYNNCEWRCNFMKNVVVIGGGTWLSTLLRGLKLFPMNITAIVTVADDGSST